MTREEERMRGFWTAVKQRGKNGQIIGSVMQAYRYLDDKPWKNEGLKKLEEALPSLKECELETCRDCTRRKQEWNATVSTQKSPMDLTKVTRGQIVELLEKVDKSGKWPQQVCTTMFFLIPKNVTSERPIALMPTLIRWWEALRALEVAKWQQKYRVDWDATDGRNGGAQRSVWEVLMEMERFSGKQKEEDQGAVALVLDLARPSSVPASLWSGPGRRISASQGKSCGCCAATLEHQWRVQFEGCAAEPLQTVTAILQGPSGVACFYVWCCRMH